MKKTGIAFLFLMIALNLFSVSCRIDFSINGLENKNLIFGYEYGNRQIVIDTILLNNEGKGFYESGRRLSGGIYLIVFPDKKYVQLLINEEQFFTVTSDTSGLLKNMIIEGSDESELFLEYLLLKQKKQINNDSMQAKAIQEFSSKISVNMPQSFLNQYIKMTISAGKSKPNNIDKIKPDKDYFLKRYNFIKNHYFDNIPFSDIRVLHTRLIYDQLDYYFNTFTAQNYDSIKASIENVATLAKVKDESYHFVLDFLYNNYKIPKNQLQERVFVYIADNFYLDGKAPWADKKFIRILESRINDLRPSTEGSIAPNLELKTLYGKNISLNEIKADYILLLFWSPECDICKYQIDRIDQLYKRFKNKNLVVLAVYTHADKAIWENFLKDKDLEWIHAYDPIMTSNFTKLYNIKALPKILLLDSDKKILLKDKSVKEIEEFMLKK